MTIHHFTLTVDGPDLEDKTLIDALFEAGCDDAAIGRANGIQFVAFDREASSLDRAILSAVVDLESPQRSGGPAHAVAQGTSGSLARLSDINLHRFMSSSDPINQ